MPTDEHRPPRPQIAAAAPTTGPATATVTVEGIGPVTLSVEALSAKPQRLASAKIGHARHHDRIDTASAARRKQFLYALADMAQKPRDALYAALDTLLVDLGNQAATNVKAAPRDRAPPSATGENQATTIAALAEGWELWHTPAGDAYATITVAGHRENWPIRSQSFKRLVAKSFYETTGKAANSDALNSASNLIEAQAAHDGPEQPVFVRVAEHDSNVYVDLCDRDWRGVEITPHTWQVLDELPVRFRRTRGMRPLPPPERGGTVDDLRRFINVDDADWPLVVAWLVGAYRPHGPYPVFALFAAQGAGKSNTAKFLRALVDPNGAPLRAEPKDAHDLMISTDGSWCIAYDNLSHLPGWLSDALCRLSTGGGFATRELYTNADEIIFDAMRPAILTSIVELAERSDLLDRCLPVGLRPLADDRRRTEKALWAEFDAARPKLLGALFDAVAGALRELPRVKLERPPRMADFAEWVTAAEPSLGWSPGTFIAAYTRNRAAANDLALEASPIAARLLTLLATNGEWMGTASDLLEALDATFSSPGARRPSDWPKNARSLSTHVKRLEPNLAAAGWRVDRLKSADSKRRLMMFTQAPDTEPEQPAAVTDDGTCVF